MPTWKLEQRTPGGGGAVTPPSPEAWPIPSRTRDHWNRSRSCPAEHRRTGPPRGSGWSRSRRPGWHRRAPRRWQMQRSRRPVRPPAKAPADRGRRHREGPLGHVVAEVHNVGAGERPGSLSRVGARPRRRRVLPRAARIARWRRRRRTAHAPRSGWEPGHGFATALCSAVRPAAACCRPATICGMAPSAAGCSERRR